MNASTRIIGVLVASTMLACRGAPEPAADAPAPGPGDAAARVVVLDDAARQSAGIATTPVARALRAEGLEAPAVVALDETRTARIGAIVDGVVVGTFAEVGDRVPADAVLATMRSQVVHDLWADYRKALAERRRAESELAFAVQAEASARRLLADQAISPQEAQRAAVDRSGAAEHLDVARTEVRRAEEALEHLGVTNKDDPSGEAGELVPARTPLGGVVLERLVFAGTAVTPGTPLFVVSDLGTVWVVAEIDETAVGRVAPGDAVGVLVGAWPDRRFPGTVSFVGDTVNPKTRRVSVRCVVPNPEGRLKPEMFARVVLGSGPPREVLVVPAAAVQQLDGASVVFVDEGGGRYRAREVAVGAEADGQAEVLDGLVLGDPVVTSGAFLLKSELLRGRAAAAGEG